MQIINDFYIQILIITTSVILLTLQKWLKDNLNKVYDFLANEAKKSYLRVIRSRITPPHLSHQERLAMQQGIIYNLKLVKDAVWASNIFLFKIKKNGTDTLMQLLKGDDYSLLDGMAIEGFESIFETLRTKDFIEILDTENEKNIDENFSNLLFGMGVKSADLILLDNELMFFYVVIYDRVRSQAIIENSFLKKGLKKWKDPIMNLYKS